jgi:hypothetical protein
MEQNEINVDQNEINVDQNNLKRYNCINCNFKTSNKYNYEKHILTLKHIKSLENEDFLLETIKSNGYICECGKFYNHRSGLWKHKKKCNNMEVKNEKDELILTLLGQNKELLEILKNSINNINNSSINDSINNNNINNNNKTFNLNFFLNETCKNAMNLSDFIDLIQPQLKDLENIGDVGYIKGISDIIISKLSSLDITERPLHCTDKKRETIYSKENNVWEKEDEKKSNLRKTIKKVNNKNFYLLKEYREKHPDYKDSSSIESDKYDKLLFNVLGGKGDNESEKEDKIISNISKSIIIDKEKM